MARLDQRRVELVLRINELRKEQTSLVHIQEPQGRSIAIGDEPV